MFDVVMLVASLDTACEEPATVRRQMRGPGGHGVSFPFGFAPGWLGLRPGAFFNTAFVLRFFRQNIYTQR